MTTIYVDELEGNGFNIYLGTDGKSLEPIESCFTEEAVHATLITLIDERLGKFLMPYHRIIHTEIGDAGTIVVSDISVIEYMEEN